MGLSLRYDKAQLFCRAFDTLQVVIIIVEFNFFTFEIVLAGVIKILY